MSVRLGSPPGPGLSTVPGVLYVELVGDLF